MAFGICSPPTIGWRGCERHGFELSFGRATVFYPEATPERCTVCLLIEVDPIGLVRRRSGPAGEGGMLTQYVNDRPYVASSFLSVAISEVFGTATRRAGALSRRYLVLRPCQDPQSRSLYFDFCFLCFAAFVFATLLSKLTLS